MSELRAFILAAGTGTRLRPLTERTAKPAVPIGGIPGIIYTLELLRKAGITELTVNVHYLPETVTQPVLEYCRKHRMQVLISYEPLLLGTGGALRFLADYLSAGRVLLINADMLLNLDLPDFLANHLRRRAIASMVLRHSADMEAYGTIGLDENCRIVRFVKSFSSGESESYRGMFTGVHLLEPEFLKYLAQELPSDINRTAYPAALRAGEQVCGYIYADSWQEYGTLKSYLDANFAVLAGRYQRPESMERELPLIEGEIISPAIICERVVVERGATVGPNVVLGADSHVSAGAELSHCVVWDRVHIAAGTALKYAVAPENGMILGLDSPPEL